MLGYNPFLSWTTDTIGTLFSKSSFILDSVHIRTFENAYQGCLHVYFTKNTCQDYINHFYKQELHLRIEFYFSLLYFSPIFFLFISLRLGGCACPRWEHTHKHYIHKRTTHTFTTRTRTHWHTFKLTHLRARARTHCCRCSVWRRWWWRGSCARVCCWQGHRWWVELRLAVTVLAHRTP